MAYQYVAIDFDKTIAEYESGTFEPSVVGKPIPGAIAFLKALKQLGFSVTIFSVRAATPIGKRAIEQWVGKYAYGLVDGVTHEKLGFFDVFIDDRAIHFGGDYKAVMKELLHRMGE